MEKLKFSTVNMVDVHDWNILVQNTYGRPYNFQQQDDCQNRGIRSITIPSESYDEDMNDSIPEEINGSEMGVKFEVWLARDPKQPIQGKTETALSEFYIELFWERNFYPDLQTVANDLHKKGLIEAGDYIINIDW